MGPVDFGRVWPKARKYCNKIPLNLSFAQTQVFTHEDWIIHRSTWRYFRHLKGLYRYEIPFVMPRLNPSLTLNSYVLFDEVSCS
jgi:hypothetical protein